MNFIVSIFGPYTFEVMSLSITFFNYQIFILIFARDLKKKDFFPLRTVLSIFLGIALCYLLAIINTTFPSIFVRVLCYLSISFMNLGTTFFCYNDSVDNLLLAFCTGNAANLIAGKLRSLLQNACGIDDRATITMFDTGSNIIPNWEWYLFFLFLYVLAWLLSIPFRPKGKPVREKSANRNIILLSIATILIVDILICISRVYEAESFALNIILKVFCVIFGFSVLLACAGILAQSEKDQN